MASKAQITTSINTLENGGNNTASEVRAVFETLNSEFFPEIDVIGNSIGGLSFTLRFSKIGRLVTVSISCTNLTSGILGNIEYQLPEKYKSLYLSYHPLFISSNRMNIELNPDVTSPVVKPSWLEFIGVPPGINFRTTLTYISNEL